MKQTKSAFARAISAEKESKQVAKQAAKKCEKVNKACSIQKKLLKKVSTKLDVTSQMGGQVTDACLM